MSAADRPSGVCRRERTIRVREEEYRVPCGSRYCPACGLRWEGDARVVAVAASEHIGTRAALITVTAPGDDVLGALMREHGLRRREVIALWNHTARVRWRALHRIAMRAARTMALRIGCTFRVLFRSWEYQRRGILHTHVVADAESHGQYECAEKYLEVLHDRGPDFGFGFILGGGRDDDPREGWPPPLRLADGPGAARYVCKYVASTGAGKDSMVTVAQRTAQRGSVLYVSRTLTGLSGATMTSLRSRRRVWSRYPWARGDAALWRGACRVDAIQRGRAPLDPAEAERVGRLVANAESVSWCDWTGEEQTGQTVAPPPGPIRHEPPPPVEQGTRVVLRLAPVLLRGGPPDHLGPWRSVAEVVA